jgi:hypothetical protein
MNIGTIVEAPVMRVKLGARAVPGRDRGVFRLDADHRATPSSSPAAVAFEGIRNNEVIASLAKKAHPSPRFPAMPAAACRSRQSRRPRGGKSWQAPRDGQRFRSRCMNGSSTPVAAVDPAGHGRASGRELLAERSALPRGLPLRRANAHQTLGMP